ncbi:CocE/NonD family hydrolase [Actinobaculum suis]|uniref:CocE/NonD family hydrolase n=1 Tax=Actinobaculum suis TaxID=1657 RepID=UPI00066FF97C|nr:CocE/NonD family hydrolase [Actinobaculum suis]KMY22854.1 peptidase S15 [Actinobaculum suis]
MQYLQPEDFPYRVKVIEDWIPVTDGTRLFMKAWMPETTEPVPAILEYLPYRATDWTLPRDSERHPYYAGHGYASIRVDIRGHGNSEGVPGEEYDMQEHLDGVDVINWIAAQDWCTGKVGMFGISWGGFNSLQLSYLQPEPLKAIVTVCSTDDRYDNDVHYMGGSMLGVDMFAWGATMLAFQSRPVDKRIWGEKWREQWLSRLEKAEPYMENWMSHQTRDEFWQHGSVCEDYSRLNTAVLAVGGWFDPYRDTVLRLVENLSALGKNVRGLIGPWSHQYPDRDLKPGPHIDFLGETLRWWDHWLKGIDTGVMEEPLLKAWIMDPIPPRSYYEEIPGRWVAMDNYPDPAITTREFTLANATSITPPAQTAAPAAPATTPPAQTAAPKSGNVSAATTTVAATDSAATDSAGMGSTDAGSTGTVPLTSYIKSPQDVGQNAGRFFPYGNESDLPTDQRADDGRSTTYDFPLTEDLQILGNCRLHLRLTTQATRGQVYVRLVDVAPDGQATLVTRGNLNLSSREGSEKIVDFPAGEWVGVEIPLTGIGYTIPAGHTLRVALSTAYWPWIWPQAQNAGITVDLAASRMEIPARPDFAALAAAGDTQAQSRLDADRAVKFAGPVQPVNADVKHPEAGRSGVRRPERLISQDVAKRETFIQVDPMYGGTRIYPDGLHYNEDAVERYWIGWDDPTTARTEAEWIVELSRPDMDWEASLKTRSTISCDAENFYVTSHVRCWDKDELIFEREWNTTIARTAS